MVKKGKGRRKKSGLRSSARGSQTSASSSTPVRESEEKDSSIQEDEISKKNITGDQESKNETPAEVQQKVSPESEGAEVADIDERIRNLDLNTPQVQDVASENIKNINEPNIEEHEETIILERDVNLRFEFDTFGSKKISVDDKVFYDIKKKQKMTFDIGDGELQLSFLGNNVYIFTQRSKIDLSIQNNQMIFSITDITKRKDVSVGKDLGISDTARAVDDDFASSKMCPEGDSESIEESMSKAISSSEEKYVERFLQNVTENFLASVKTTCEKFETSFLESLKKGSEEELKK